MLAVGRQMPTRYVLAWIDGDVAVLHLRSGLITHLSRVSFHHLYTPTDDYRAAYRYVNGE